MRGLLASVALAAALLASPVVYAQSPNCAPRDVVIKDLTEKYREKPVAMGFVNDKIIMEAYLSKQQTWTILLTRADGMTCLVASGEAWEFTTDAFQSGDPS